MREYNGFPSNVRARAGKYRKRMIAEGRIPSRPPFCRACGQTEGAMCYHTEDYSEPHGPHIVAFEICYACHMMIHCRHRNPERWIEYIEEVQAGSTFEPIHGWNFKAFCALYMSRGGLPDRVELLNVPAGIDRAMLIDIQAGAYNPVVSPEAVGYAPQHIREACTGDVSG